MSHDWSWNRELSAPFSSFSDVGRFGCLVLPTMLRTADEMPFAKPEPFLPLRLFPLCRLVTSESESESLLELSSDTRTSLIIVKTMKAWFAYLHR